MPIVKLYDGETGMIYNLEVSEEDAVKVDQGMIY